MTRSYRKKRSNAQADADPLVDQGNAKDTKTSKAPPTSKQGASKDFRGSFKNKKPTVAPKFQVGLLVTDELAKAIEECKTKVAQIVKGCRAANRRFRDTEFDLENDGIRCLKGLNCDEESEVPPAVLRLTQIFEKPQFVVDGADAVDIIQGSLGDCWLLSALATMSTSKGLIEKLCVARDEEVGVYGFVFFRGSTWVNVIIDDQFFWSLPKYEELSGREQDLYRGDKEAYNRLARHGGKGLYFARSGTEEETWVPLIEKAYAKLHGDYQSLEGGLTSEAIEDLTGGVSVMYATNDILDKDRFWNEELLFATKDRLFACSFDGLDTSRKNEYEVIAGDAKVNGLIGSHAYSVLRVKECKGKRFVVIRNPWGASEWTGAWGDGSKEWVGEWLDVLKELNHVFGDDGEFVMEYSDFLDTFQMIERTTIFDSNWVMSSHWLRVPPQPKDHPWSFGDLSFNFVLSEPSFTIISLSKLDTRYFKDISGISQWNIDFVVYKRGEKDIRGVSYYAVLQARSVTCELHLEAGEYIIFPRYDRYSSEEPGYFEVQSKDWDERKLSRVLTERAKSRSLAANLPEGIDSRRFPTSIETLIEHDLEKLEEENQEVVEDDGDGDWEEEASNVEEAEGGSMPVSGKEDESGEPEDDEEKAESDAVNEIIEELGFGGLFGGDENNEPADYFDDEDSDPITLGVRIYTKGGVVDSLTGHVINDDEDNDEKAQKQEVKTKDKKTEKDKVDDN